MALCHYAVGNGVAMRDKRPCLPEQTGVLFRFPHLLRLPAMALSITVPFHTFEFVGLFAILSCASRARKLSHPTLPRKYDSSTTIRWRVRRRHSTLIDASHHLLMQRRQAVQRYVFEVSLNNRAATLKMGSDGQSSWQRRSPWTKKGSRPCKRAARPRERFGARRLV